MLELSRLGFKVGSESYSNDCDSTNALVYEQDPMYVYGKHVVAGTVFSLTYKAGNELNFEEYIRNLVIDTIPAETPLP